MKIKYNAWDTEYKSPFGAIKARTTVTWRVKIDEPVDYINLWLTKAEETPVPYPMKKTDEQTYHVQVTIGTSGLYHYYFEIKQSNQISYYQEALGGEGELVTSNQNLAQYQLTCYDEEVPQVDWYQDGIVYQIFPDRFNNGNPHGEILGKKKNSFIYATEEDTPFYVKDEKGDVVRWDFFGGNLKGIEQKIPYLKKLGVTIVYLNPIFWAESSHRYDTNDFMKIDPMLGTEVDFISLVHALHKNGMYLILDGVFNHVGDHSHYFQEAIKSKANPYYSWFYFTNYPTEYDSWWGITNLPKVNKANPGYQNLIYGEDGVLVKWTSLGVDGWRLDIADELPMEFLRQIRRRLSALDCQVLIGEVWEDASHKYVNNELRTYTSGDNLTGTMNYPLRNFILEILRSQDHEEAMRIIDRYLRIVEDYPAAFLKNCLNNIGTHDTARIKNELGENEDLVALALAIMMMLPGVPCIYYGDEAGLSGGKDPQNRAYFPWNRESAKLEQITQLWCRRRRKNRLLVDGRIGIISTTQNLTAIVRYDTKEVNLFWFNKTESEHQLNFGQAIFYAVPDQVRQIIVKNDLGKKLAARQGLFEKFNL